MIDYTPLEHVAIALAFTLLGWISGDVWAGCMFGCGLFVGREHAQAEYRWVEEYGYGKRNNMPWYGGFDPLVWDVGSILDVVCAVAAAALLAFALTFWL
jgi:hypothetical protein